MKNRIRTGGRGLEVDVEVMLVKEGDYCTGYGKTQAEAKRSFRIEADIFFEETAKRGTLEELLIEYGWVLSKGNFRPPSGVDAVSVANLLHAQATKPAFYTSKLAIPV